MARTHRLARGAAVLGAGALVAGCSFMTPIQTLEPYSPSDGVRVLVTDEVRAESLLVLAAEEGAEGQVFGILVNDTQEEVTMGVTIGDDGIQVPVAAGDTVLLGEEEPVIIPSTPAPPGAMVETSVEASGYGTVTAPVPVLDDTFPPYDEHVP